MAYSKIEQTVLTLAQPIAEQNGCYIYDVEYVKEGGLWFLRVFADKETEGITLDECEAVSRALSEVLDREDPISQNYYLEVSSPGVERKLKTPEHFARYVGETVDIGLYRAVNGSKTLTGVLKGLHEGAVTAEIGGEEIAIPLKETTYVKLHFEF